MYVVHSRNLLVLVTGLSTSVDDDDDDDDFEFSSGCSDGGDAGLENGRDDL